jgi:SP family facilitated glucose transporter-like MFS transporter 1
MYSSYELIIIGRFIIGINSGLNAGLTPMYLAEISPMNLRGSVSIIFLGTIMRVWICRHFVCIFSLYIYIIHHLGIKICFALYIQVGTVYQLVVTISILISQILGLDYILGTAERWPILLALIIIPGIFMFITLPFCPESPKYTLINKKKDIEAERGKYIYIYTYNIHSVL